MNMKKHLFATLAAALLSIALTTVATAQQTFKSADEAVDALANAARAGDGKTISTILGPAAADIVSSGDRVEDENSRKIFVAAFDAQHHIDGKTLLIGPDDYPFPIPLVENNGNWSFDGAAGREEVLARRIGRNELSTIQVCLAYFDAQNDYADLASSTTGSAAYAQRIVSRPGKKDGLYWPTSGNETPSPIGEAVAVASARGYRVGSGEPYHGYFYKVLKRQGPAAPGGELDYVVNGKMIGGFALVAWPAQYGNSGITTFIINNDGTIFEKDLGPGTAKTVAGLTWFNPGEGWQKVDVIDEK
jgi:hypothetical protein